jgi:hypothetical protein
MPRRRITVDANLPALFAAVADSVAVCAHGVVGHRWFMGQLRSVELQPTRLFGDPDVSWRVFAVTWHAVTVVFVACAVALYLVGFGAVESRELLRFIAIIHAAFLGVGLVYLVKRLDAVTRPIPPIFVTCMVAVTTLAWAASNSG